LNYTKHPFYENAEIQTFLARQNGKIVGRIAAIIDRAHNEFHSEERGMFGFFESVDDQDVANALFDTAKAWFAERNIFLMRGPANPSQNYEWGMLVEGFHSPPTFMMTYNKPYYGKLVESYGFFKSQDLYSYIGRTSMIDDLDPKLLFIANESKKRFNVHPRPISKKNFDKDVASFLEIYNTALPGQWGFTPMSANELKATASGLKMLIVPEMTTMAEIEGRPVATVFGLLDFNPTIKSINGRLFPFGFLKILLGKKKIKRVRLISTNVIPEYQRWGLGLVLLQRLVPDILKWGIKELEFSWVLESNKLSRGTLERGGSIKDKTYRIYDYEP
ncbi:MAG: GNAT family N-acetyltransferase, partial [Mariniblastus sp.]|nr:GNAT family N-acetyltransferase [Mariniblastus sp.]